MEKQDKNLVDYFQQIIIGLCGFAGSIFAFIVALKLTLFIGSITELILAILAGIFLIKKYPQQQQLKALSWGIVIGSTITLFISILATSLIFGALEKMIN